MGKLEDFIALDVETSGLNFRTDQIIEICVMLVSNGAITSMFNALVYPNDDLYAKGLDPKVTELTGHTLEALEGGLPEEDIAHILDAILRPFNVPIVAFNGLFDLSFIDSLFARYSIDYLPHDFLDPCTIARDRKNYPHRLKEVCHAYGVELPQAHSAHDDTLALVDLFFAMQDEDSKQRGRTDWKAVEWYVNKAGYLRKYEEPEWVAPHFELYPQGQLPDVRHKPKQNKPVQSKPTTLPKYENVVVSNAGKKKKLPQYDKMSTEEFSKEFMPTGFLAQHYQNVIDTYFGDPFTGGWCEVCIPGMTSDEGHAEFDRIIEYLQHVHKVADEDLSSYLDNPEEAVIEFRKPDTSRMDEDPFAYSKRPIEISEDDLPF